eukprot:3100500-Prymnesium_polylepis.1
MHFSGQRLYGRNRAGSGRRAYSTRLARPAGSRPRMACRAAPCRSAGAARSPWPNMKPRRRAVASAFLS